MTNIDNLTYVYDEGTVTELTRATNGCGVIWSKVAPNQYYTHQTKTNPSQFWEFYVGKQVIGQNSVYYLNVFVNTKQTLTINSAAIPDLSILFDAIESKVLNPLAKQRRLAGLLSTLSSCLKVYDLFGFGGVLVGGTGLVSGSGGQNNGFGIYVAGFLGSASNELMLKKYNKAVIDSLTGDPSGGPSDLFWTFPENGFAAESVVVDKNGTVYVTGSISVSNIPDTFIIDQYGNEIRSLTHHIDCTNGSPACHVPNWTTVAIDSKSNIILGGGIFGNLLGNTPPVNLCKHAPDGTLLLSTNWTTPFNDNGQIIQEANNIVKICVDENDNFYALSDSSPTLGNLAKFNSNGNIVWQINLLSGGIPNDMFYYQRYLYLCGNTFLAKYDLSGTLIWQINETTLDHLPYAAQLNKIYVIGGKIFVAGTYNGTNATPLPSPVCKYLVRCFDTDGNSVWEMGSLSQPPQVCAQLHAITSDGQNVYVGGDLTPLFVLSASTGAVLFNITGLTDFVHDIYLDPASQNTTPPTIGGVLVGGSAQVGDPFNPSGQGGVLVGGSAQMYIDQAPVPGIYLTVADTNQGRYIFKLDKYKFDTTGTPVTSWVVPNHQNFLYSDANGVYIQTLNGNLIEVDVFNFSGNQQLNDTFGAFIDPTSKGMIIDNSGFTILCGTVFTNANYTIVKLQPNKSFLWGINTNAFVNSVTVDLNNNIYAGSGLGITKYDPNGSLLWTRNSGLTVNKVLFYNNFVYMGGLIGLTNEGYVQATTRKFDLQGNLLWSMGTDHIVYDMAIDSQGYLYTAGSDDSSGTGTYGFIKKYDVNGTLLWKSRGVLPTTSLNNICIDSDDRIYSIISTGSNGEVSTIVLCDPATGQLSSVSLSTFFSLFNSQYPLSNAYELNLDYLSIQRIGGLLASGNAILA